MLSQFFFFILLLHIDLWPVNSAYELTLLHTNDFESRFEETDVDGGICLNADKQAGKCFGGVARMKSAITSIRAKHPNVLNLAAGDQYYGTAFFYLYEGDIVVKFMNLLGIDAFALGHSELNNGPTGLLPLLHKATFPILSANMNTTREPILDGKIVPSTVFTIGGEKIGIIGYITQETPVLAIPGDTLTFSDEIEAIQREVDILTSKGVNKIIALGHSGFDVDLMIAKKVKGVDVVIGGKSNTFLYNGEPPSTEVPEGAYPHVVTHTDRSRVLVVQTAAYYKYLGFLQVTFDYEGNILSWNGNPILLNISIPLDTLVLFELEPFQEEVFNLTLQQSGRTAVPLDGSDHACYVKECNMGNVVCDALIWKTTHGPTSGGWNEVAIAMVSPERVRSSIPAGDINFFQVVNVLPFEDIINIVELKGKHVLALLEYIAENVQSQQGFSSFTGFPGFLQFSGLKVTYNFNQPVGNRVGEVFLRCHKCAIPQFLPLDINEVYPIAMNSFIAGGGLGFDIIKNNALSRIELNFRMTEVLAEYFVYRAPIVTGLEGRITTANVRCSSGAAAVYRSLMSLIIVLVGLMSY